MTDVFDAAALLGQSEASSQDKLDQIQGKDTVPDQPINDNPPVDTSAVTSANIGKTERAPAPGEGSRAFGAPLGPGDIPQARTQQTREEIQAEITADIQRMNQSTNSANKAGF